MKMVLSRGNSKTDEFVIQKLAIVILFLVLANSVCGQSKECKKIKQKIDTLKGTITYSSPLMKPIHFIKRISQKDHDHNESKELVRNSLDSVNDIDINYYVLLSVTGPTTNGGKQTMLTFEDGEVLKRKVITTLLSMDSKTRVIHSALVPLDSKDVQLISEKLITDIKVHTYVSRIRKPEKYRNYLKCLIAIE